jgi:hypothetical protein
MTMDDDIQLPLLPPFVIAPIADEQTVLDYAAILADRERRVKVAAKPVVHEARVGLSRDGFAWTDATLLDPKWVVTTVTLRWTDDGRAWIESERNRKLAAALRRILPRLYASAPDINAAADALDGGVR